MIKKDIVGQIKDLPIMMFGKSTKIQSDPQKHIDVVSKSKEKDLIEKLEKENKLLKVEREEFNRIIKKKNYT